MPPRGFRIPFHRVRKLSRIELHRFLTIYEPQPMGSLPLGARKAMAQVKVRHLKSPKRSVRNTNQTARRRHVPSFSPPAEGKGGETPRQVALCGARLALRRRRGALARGGVFGDKMGAFGIPWIDRLLVDFSEKGGALLASENHGKGSFYGSLLCVGFEERDAFSAF